MMFVSKRKNLRVVLRPTDKTIDTKGRVMVIRGLTAEFGGGRYETDDEEVIRALLEHPYKNIEYTPADDEKAWLEAHQEDVPQLVTGVRSTVPVRPQIQKKPIDIEELVNQRVEEKLAELLAAVDKVPVVEVPEEEPKKVYKCKDCKAIFENLSQLSEHKKLHIDPHEAKLIGE